MAIAAEVLLFIEHVCTTFCTTFCTGQTRNDGLVISCNPYP
jgi:IMP dehydrogenase